MRKYYSTFFWSALQTDAFFFFFPFLPGRLTVLPSNLTCQLDPVPASYKEMCLASWTLGCSNHLPWLAASCLSRGYALGMRDCPVTLLPPAPRVSSSLLLPSEGFLLQLFKQSCHPRSQNAFVLIHTALKHYKDLISIDKVASK